MILTTDAELRPYYLGAQEVRCHDGSDPCPVCRGAVRLAVETAAAFRDLRDALGGPLLVTSGYRCLAKEERLWQQELAATGGDRRRAMRTKAPPSPRGPHPSGRALDIAKPDRFTTALEFGRWIEQILGGRVRIGCRAYRAFAHIDTLHLIQPRLATGIRW